MSLDNNQSHFTKWQPHNSTQGDKEYANNKKGTVQRLGLTSYTLD